MIRPCNDADFDTIYAIINEAAEAYRGVIPPIAGTNPTCRGTNCAVKSRAACGSGATKRTGELVGVMGIQDVQDVTLIRHAYVRTAKRSQGHWRETARRVAADGQSPDPDRHLGRRRPGRSGSTRSTGSRWSRPRRRIGC